MKKTKLKIISCNAGTTLIELVVGIAIISIITGTVLANFRAGERHNNLNIAVQKLVSDIRQAQNFALSLKAHNGDVPAGGWGVYFNTVNDANRRYYTIFADIDASRWCQNANNCPVGYVEHYAQIDLPAGVSISQLRVTAGVRTRGSITFEPPDPDVYFSYGMPATTAGSSMEITLSNNSGSKTLVINKFGLVDIK